MKLTRILVCLCLISIILEAAAFHSRLRSKSKSRNKLKSKKFASMQDYLSELDKEAKKAQEREERGGAGKNKTFEISNKNFTKPKRPYSNPDVLLENDQQIDLLHEGWLKISNPTFTKTKIYPRLNLPNGKVRKIPTERNFFRMNPEYDPFETNPTNAPGPFYFYFRLSRTNMFYGQTKNNINIVGDLAVKNFREVTPLPEFARQDECFTIDDVDVREWTLCAETVPERNEWVCIIRDLLNQEEYNQCKDKIDADTNIPVITQKVTEPMIMIPLASPMCNQDYDYNDYGSDWECDCREGKEQSPINLPNFHKSIKSPVKPVFEYVEVDVKNLVTNFEGGIKTTENLQIRYENHAVRINAQNFGQVVTLDGSVYKAQEIVFHTPAEHQIDGKRFDMEMQIIHYGQTKGDIAKQVVLSFLFEKKPGVYNKFIDDIDFFSLPNPITKTRDLVNNLYLPKIFYNSESQDVALWKPFSFYTYQGSLTAPPCTERTITYVASQPIPLGTTAISLFQEALRMPDLMAPNGDVIVSNGAVFNNRKIQKRNGRVVFYYDAEAEMCPDGNRGRKKKVGHYEKIDRDLYQYYFVNGSKPSGMPGALVVSEGEAVGGGNIFNTH